MVLKSIADFAFPLFAQYIYRALHYGWVNIVLALAGVVIGILAYICSGSLARGLGRQVRILRGNVGREWLQQRNHKKKSPNWV